MGFVVVIIEKDLPFNNAFRRSLIWPTAGFLAHLFGEMIVDLTVDFTQASIKGQRSDVSESVMLGAQHNQGTDLVIFYQFKMVTEAKVS